MDELYAIFLFEEDMVDDFSAIHCSQGLTSTSGPGLSNRIGLLDQNYVSLEMWLNEDEASEYYEEVS